MGAGLHKALVEYPIGWPFLAMIGMVKGIVSVVPCTLALVLSYAVCLLVNTPQNWVKTWKAIYNTKKLAPKIKVMASVLYPFFYLLGLPLASVVGLVGVIGYSLFAPAVYTFMEDHTFISGWKRTWSDCFYYAPKEIWDTCYEKMPQILQEFENQELKEGEEPFDVPLWWLFIGFLYAIAGAIGGFIPGLALGIVHFLPAAIKVGYYVLKYYFESWREPCLGVTLTIFVLPALVLGVAGTALLSLVGAPIVATGIGISSAAQAYNHGYRSGFKRIGHAAYLVSEFFSKHIYGDSSWFSFLKED